MKTKILATALLGAALLSAPAAHHATAAEVAANSTTTAQAENDQEQPPQSAQNIQWVIQNGFSSDVKTVIAQHGILVFDPSPPISGQILDYSLAAKGSTNKVLLQFGKFGDREKSMLQTILAEYYPNDHEKAYGDVLRYVACDLGMNGAQKEFLGDKLFYYDLGKNRNPIVIITLE